MQANMSAEQWARQGLQELQNNRLETARDCLTHAIEAGYTHPDVFVALGHSFRRLGQVEPALQHFTQALKLNPRHLRALLGKAETLEGQQRQNEAAQFFSAAMKLVPDPDAIPADLRPVFMRGFELIQLRQQSLETALDAQFPEMHELQANSPRFAGSLDMLLGRTRPYYQQPTRYHYPDLPQRAVYDRSEFEWASALEAQTDMIRSELLGLLPREAGFRPYLEASDETIRLRDSALVNNPDWSAYYLWKQGELQDDAKRSCPRTIEALQSAPLDHLTGQAPSVLFSVLKPGAYIPPHNGMLNTRLICHLPLIVPDNCGIRIGNDIINWREGELVIFDDSVEHEAWNRSDQTRVILLFEIWKPELSVRERAEITELFDVLAHSGT
ncbi:MAG: hydroxylase [Hirschia sp.]|nr:hydroxylase [Hirschia sp.]MBF20115.1 hydroxylase [Hirschia sp.]